MPDMGVIQTQASRLPDEVPEIMEQRQAAPLNPVQTLNPRKPDLIIIVVLNYLIFC